MAFLCTLSLFLVCVFYQSSSIPITDYSYHPHECPDCDYNIFQGDMALSAEQKQFLSTGSTKKRGVMSRNLWPNAIIPYKIDAQFDEKEKDKIRNAMDEWENNTCIRFVKHTNEAVFIDIVSYMYGCWSVVGSLPKLAISKIPSNGHIPLKMSLSGSSCLRHSTILHELGHVIGFFDEHLRPDRDDNVKIFLNNVIGTAKGKFENKINSNLINPQKSNYDPNSIMHYGPNAFSRNKNLVTIEGIKGHVVKLNTKLSALDISQTNSLYQCPTKAPPTVT